MANETVQLSTVSSVLEEAVTSNENNTADFIGSHIRDDLTSSLFRYVWPLICLTGLVGNTLVLFVLRRDGLARFSANVYLTALAVGDSLVLMVASVTVYPLCAWGLWLDGRSIRACRAILPVHHVLVNASIWIIAAFTAERCVAIRFPLLKLRLCTPNNAAALCLSLLVLAFFKNIDVVIRSTPATFSSGDVVCLTMLRDLHYLNDYRLWINLVATTAVPLAVVVVCNWAIIGKLRQNPMRTNSSLPPPYH